LAVNRLLPTPEAEDLLELTRAIVRKDLCPVVDWAERSHAAFRRDVPATLGRAGLLSQPYPEEVGGGGQPYEVYPRVLKRSHPRGRPSGSGSGSGSGLACTRCVACRCFMPVPRDSTGGYRSSSVANGSARTALRKAIRVRPGSNARPYRPSRRQVCPLTAPMPGLLMAASQTCTPLWLAASRLVKHHLDPTGYNGW
jgi:hypothetical protein